MINAKKARQISDTNSFNLDSINDELDRINNLIKQASANGEYAVAVIDIPYQIYQQINKALLSLGYKVDIDNFSDGSPVKFRICW